MAAPLCNNGDMIAGDRSLPVRSSVQQRGRGAVLVSVFSIDDSSRESNFCPSFERAKIFSPIGVLNLTLSLPVMPYDLAIYPLSYQDSYLRGKRGRPDVFRGFLANLECNNFTFVGSNEWVMLLCRAERFKQ